MTLLKPAEAQGKVLLMEAALRLAARTRSLQALGIREIGREAGLNPNTFYRHFKDLDALGLAIIQSVAEELREPLRALRHEAAATAGIDTAADHSPLRAMGFDMGRAKRVVSETVKLFFQFAAEKPEAFQLGVCELHGASPVLRGALREVMADFAADMAEDIREARMLPMLSEKALADLSSVTIREMFQLSMDYIEQPGQRATIAAQAESMILMLLTGAVLLAKTEEQQSRQAPVS